MKSLGAKKFYCNLSEREEDRFTNRDIRESSGKLINRYPNLVAELAKVAYYNPGYSFFYRGQQSDFTTKRNSTSIYPTLFRNPGRRLTTSKRPRRPRGSEVGRSPRKLKDRTFTNQFFK